MNTPSAPLSAALLLALFFLPSFSATAAAPSAASAGEGPVGSGNVRAVLTVGRGLGIGNAQLGATSCIKLLVSARGDVNWCDSNGRSSIIIASSKGHVLCVEQLLASLADPRSSRDGKSALDLARRYGHLECVRVLEAALQ
jgi:hypothetical protein